MCEIQMSLIRGQNAHNMWMLYSSFDSEICFNICKALQMHFKTIGNPLQNQYKSGPNM